MLTMRVTIKSLLVLVLLGSVFLVIWLRGPFGLKGVLWQNPNECLPGLSCPTESVSLVSYGAYDPASELQGNANIIVDHIFLSWTYDNTSSLAEAKEKANLRGRKLFVSLEPWPSEELTKETLLKDIANGGYDMQTTKFCGQMSSLGNNAWISWGHEMDHDLTERYPWSNKTAIDFITAYNHFVQLCRTVSPEAQFIWSPVGNSNLEPYWPGADTVDMVGVPVYSYPEFDKKTYGHDRTFKEAFGEKYARLTKFQKPVVIVELGVFGKADYQQYWLDQAKLSYKTFPLLNSVIFFNAQDTPGAWGADYATPDWRLQPGVDLH